MWAQAKEYGGKKELGTAPKGQTLVPREGAACPTA